MNCRKARHITAFVILTLISGHFISAQKKPTKYKLNNDKSVVFSIDLNMIESELDSILVSFGVSRDVLQSVWSEKMDTTFNGWKLTLFSDDVIELTKGLSTPGKGFQMPGEMIIMEDVGANGLDHTYFPVADYGTNEFKSKPSVYEDGEYTYFIYKDDLNARSVYLSGNFNSWSTLENPMYRTANGWETKVRLSPGKHLYKFIVDGNWTNDPNNHLKEDDGFKGLNSVYFRYNHEFFLGGYTDAKKVYVSGSFNGWKEKELRMEKAGLGWKLDMFVKEGTHAYKFIVNGDWVLDPANDVVRDDGAGNMNNYFSIGDTFYFELEGFQNADRVMVAGNFNVWNDKELEMERTGSGWELPYVLAPGVYEYKFVVDGDWMTDPGNEVTTGHGDYLNSVLVVEPNVKFILPGHSDAEEVFITGTFNNWSNRGMPMRREDENWVAEIYLRPGKYAYKFIVDGQWMPDPNNDLWEKNEFGTKNSVIWIEARDYYQIEN
jgi:hypothetical protein